MNPTSMFHTRTTLIDEPREAVYLDTVSIERYRGIICALRGTNKRFHASTTDDNNHAAQAAHINKMKRAIKRKLKAECRHDYVERDTGTSCSKCRMRFS
jgi:hypothetical protein